MKIKLKKKKPPLFGEHWAKAAKACKIVSINLNSMSKKFLLKEYKSLKTSFMLRKLNKNL